MVDQRLANKIYIYFYIDFWNKLQQDKYYLIGYNIDNI